MNQNGLIDILEDKACGLLDKLFCEENDHRQAMDLIEKFYDKKVTELPSLDDVMEHVDEYNSNIIYELADMEMYANCFSCLDKETCWPIGMPELENMWNEEFRNDSQESNQDNCLSDYIEITHNHIINNYGSWYDLREFVLEIISMLGYSVLLEESDLHLVYDAVPVFYFGDSKFYFNDAQGVLIPDFSESAKIAPRLLITRHPLLITA